MTQVRFIEANALQAEFMAQYGKRSLLVDMAPTVEIPKTIQEAIQYGIFHEQNSRPNGMWIVRNRGKHTEYRECPYCGRRKKYTDNFCPQCGAELRGEECE